MKILKKEKVCQFGLPDRLEDTQLFRLLRRGKKQPDFLVENKSRQAVVEECLKAFPNWNPAVLYYASPRNEETVPTEEIEQFLEQNKIDVCRFSMTDSEAYSFTEIKKFKNMPLYDELVLREKTEKIFTDLAQKMQKKIETDEPLPFAQLSEKRLNEIKTDLIDKLNQQDNLKVHRVFYQHLLMRLQNKDENVYSEETNVPETKKRENEDSKIIHEAKEMSLSLGFNMVTKKVTSQEIYDSATSLIETSQKIRKMPRRRQSAGIDVIRNVAAKIESALFDSNMALPKMKRVLKTALKMLEDHALTNEEKRHRDTVQKDQERKNRLAAEQEAQAKKQEVETRKKEAAEQQHLTSVSIEENLSVVELEIRKKQKLLRIERNREIHQLKSQRKKELSQIRAKALTPTEKRERNRKKIESELKAQRISQKKEQYKKSIVNRYRRRENG